jgi:hypothetical protein
VLQYILQAKKQLQYMYLQQDQLQLHLFHLKEPMRKYMFLFRPMQLLKHFRSYHRYKVRWSE